MALTAAAELRPQTTPGMLASGFKAFFRIMDLWQVDNRQAMVLLGRPARATFFRWKRGLIGHVPHDTVQRISYVLGIYKALQVLYADPILADGWVRRANRAFADRPPVERMLGGDIADLAAVRAHLDAARGGWS